MRPHNSTVRNLRNSPQQGQFGPRLVYVLVTIILTMATLACNSFFGDSSGDVIIRSQLPTLTRTPLPTLTPTAVAIGDLPVDQSIEASTAIHEGIESVENNSPQVSNNPIIETQQIETQNKTVPSYANDETDSTGLENSVILIAEPSNQAQNQPAVDPAIAQVSQTSPDDQVIDAPVNISATDTATPIPTASLPTATATPLPTDTPTSTPTVPPTPTTLPDWVFMNTQVYPDPAGNGLLMFGNFINNTGLAQEIMSLSAIFYDEQGQVIAETRARDAYWPGFVVAPNGSMPFELTVADIENASDFVLTVEAEPSGELPQENFEFSDLNQKDEGIDYCVSGEFNNPGQRLRNYLIITAIFYNSEDNVVNFGHYSVYYPEGVEADPGFDFDLCADGFNQDVARYELQAWGL